MEFSLQRKTELALRALRVLGRSRNLVSGSELAGELGTSVGYLPQVMAPLVARGWVTSERGPNGGYRGRGANPNLLDLIETTEGPVPPGKCVLRGGPCPGELTCALHDGWQRAQARLIEELARVDVLEGALTI